MTHKIHYKQNNQRKNELLNYLRFYDTRDRKMKRVKSSIISQLENYQSLTPLQFEVIVPLLQKEEKFIRSSEYSIKQYFKILIRFEYLADIFDLLVEPKYNGKISFM